MVQYTSQQLKIGEFGNLYQMKLDPCNQWIQLAAHFPWDECAKIYGTNANRNRCRERGIRMTVAPKGRRPPETVYEKKEFNERNQIEGRFGRAKQGCGLNNIKTKLSNTPHSWIGAILFVTDPVKFAEPYNFRFRLSKER